MYFHLFRRTSSSYLLSGLFSCQTLAFWSHLTLILLVLVALSLFIPRLVGCCCSSHDEHFHYVKRVRSEANEKLSRVRLHCQISDVINLFRSTGLRFPNDIVAPSLALPTNFFSKLINIIVSVENVCGTTMHPLVDICVDN